MLVRDAAEVEAAQELQPQARTAAFGAAGSEVRADELGSLLHRPVKAFAPSMRTGDALGQPRASPLVELSYSFEVMALSSVDTWNQYQEAFPPATSATQFDAFYFDATALLLDRLQQVSFVLGGNLVIDRKALALAVRSTRGFPGVTCTITLDPLTGNRINDQTGLTRCAS